MGRWMAVNGEAIRGTTASPFAKAPFRATSKPNRLYLFLRDWTAGPLLLPGLRTLPCQAALLADPTRSPLAFSQADAGVVLTLAAPPGGPVWPVVRLEFDQAPEVAS